MINRVLEYLEEPEERPPEMDYWMVATPWDTYFVTRAVAERVIRDMSRILPRRWIRFTDVYGAEVRVRRAWIGQVREWTQAHRAAARRFNKALRDEDPERRPWEQ